MISNFERRYLRDLYNELDDLMFEQDQREATRAAERAAR